jgi:hypothetical protein
MPLTTIAGPIDVAGLAPRTVVPGVMARLLRRRETGPG